MYLLVLYWVVSKAACQHLGTLLLFSPGVNGKYICLMSMCKEMFKPTLDGIDIFAAPTAQK